MRKYCAAFLWVSQVYPFTILQYFKSFESCKRNLPEPSVGLSVCLAMCLEVIYRVGSVVVAPFATLNRFSDNGRNTSKGHTAQCIKLTGVAAGVCEISKSCDTAQWLWLITATFRCVVVGVVACYYCSTTLNRWSSERTNSSSSSKTITMHYAGGISHTIYHEPFAWFTTPDDDVERATRADTITAGKESVAYLGGLAAYLLCTN